MLMVFWSKHTSSTSNIRFSPQTFSNTSFTFLASSQSHSISHLALCPHLRTLSPIARDLYIDTLELRLVHSSVLHGFVSCKSLPLQISAYLIHMNGGTAGEIRIPLSLPLLFSCNSKKYILKK